MKTLTHSKNDNAFKIKCKITNLNSCSLNKKIMLTAMSSQLGFIFNILTSYIKREITLNQNNI
jgi:hypothetical protein